MKLVVLHIAIEARMHVANKLAMGPSFKLFFNRCSIFVPSPHFSTESMSFKHVVTVSPHYLNHQRQSDITSLEGRCSPFSVGNSILEDT